MAYNIAKEVIFMYGQYNPYPYPNPYQQRLAQLEQQAYQQPLPQPLQAPQNASNIKGRVVGSVEEAKAAQVDFDGSTSYFVCLGEGKIYAKSIGLNGLPVFQTYALDNNNKPDVAKNSQNDDLKCRLDALEAKVKELYDEHNATVTAGQ